MQEQTKKVNPSARSEFRAWIVCLTASLFFFYEFVQMMMFNVINANLMSAFHITATTVSEISAMYFLANTLFMFPAGILLDRFSTRKIILAAMLLCVSGTLLFSNAHTIGTAMLCRFMVGIGGSFPFLCCLKLASRWFPNKRLALVTGTIVTVAMLGGVCGLTPMTFLTTHYGWRTALQLDACLGVVFIFLIYFLVRDYPRGHQFRLIPQAKDFDVWGSILKAMGNVQNWLYGLYTCMLNLPILVLCAVFGNLYLEQIYHFSSAQASHVVSMILIGTIFGGPLLGAYSDRLELRKLPMYIGAWISLGLLIIILGCHQLNVLEMSVLFFWLGFFTSSQVISYPAIAESNDIAMSGSALGLASVLIMGGGAVFQPVCGWLMDRHWNGAMIANVPQYQPHDFLWGFSIFPIACILAILFTRWATETYCQHMTERRKTNGAYES